MKKKKLLMLLCAFVLGAWMCPLQADIDLRVMSFNIRCINNEDAPENQWDKRADRVCDYIKEVSPDVFGLQEAVPKQYEDVKARVEGYGSIFAGRDDGTKGEGTPIFYRSSKFRLVKSGHYWLSATPDVPSQGWHSTYQRIVLWVILEDKVSGESFIYTNTHVSGDDGNESAKLLKERIHEIAPVMPCVFNADFNSNDKSETYKLLVNYSYPCIDTWKAAKEREGGPGTLDIWGTVSNIANNKIDFIFASEGTEVERAVIAPAKNQNGDYISDHKAIWADLKLKKDNKQDSYLIWEPQLGIAEQISSNSLSTDDGGSYEGLIDGDINTIFHSVWHADMALSTTTNESWKERLATLSGGKNNDPGYHFLQVALSEPVNSFCFEYKSRNSDWHDNPNHIEIFATNDQILGSSPTNANQNQWTRITELTPENTDFPKDVLVINAPWRSPEIKMPEPFRYIRFVVKGTTHMNTVDTRMFAVPEITGVTFNLSEFQIYVPRESTGPGDELQALVDSVANLFSLYGFEFGTDPGYTDQAKFEVAHNLYEQAEAALYDGTAEDVLAQYCNDLRAVIADLFTTGIHQIETGYYYIVNSYAPFAQYQGVTKSLYVNKDKQLGWTSTNANNAAQLWYIEKQENGNFSIKNVATNEYIGVADDQSKYVPMTAACETGMVIEWQQGVAGQFHIYGVGNSNMSLSAEGYNDGMGVSGLIIAQEGTGNSVTEWYMRPVTDQAVIDKLEKQGPQALLVEEMLLVLDSARNSRNKANDYKALITRADQIASNAQSSGDGSSYAGLIDGNTETIFHSAWDNAIFKSIVPLGSSYGWHNLQFTLDEPVSKITFEFTGRNDPTYCDIPNHITIYATNDEALGTSTAAVDSSQWNEILDMTNKEYHFPLKEALAYYSSPEIDLGSEYKYLRFVVKSTVNSGPGGVRPFASPQATGITFNLSEFQIYDAIPTEKSQYYKVDGMKEACDALDAAIAVAEGKLGESTITEADITALQTAYRLVDSTYIDRNSLFSQLTSLLESGNNLYDMSKGSRVALINEVSQLSTNSIDSNVSSLANLIDGKRDTYFHSVWDYNSAINKNLTADLWQELLATKYPESAGTGYHNLNVELTEPVSQFYFEFHSRNDNKWHDNPSDIAIYATNDVDLFSDVRDSRTDEWTLIDEITEGIPTNVTGEVPYTSPIIELRGEYKFIRFVIKNVYTANASNEDPSIGSPRTYTHPEITGITWSCSEFQMYSGLAPESIQYNYIPEVRTAADELKVMLEKYAAYTSSDINSKETVDELAAAIIKLREAYVDTTEIVNLYKEYKNMVSISIDGDYIGDIDSYDAIEEFDLLLDEARNSVDLKRPTKEQVNNATERINSGYDDFMSHVILPEPYQWYVIRSGVTDNNYAFAINQPIYLNDISIGADIKIGGYQNDGREFLDVYSIWRLVPIENDGSLVKEEIKPWEMQFAIQNLGTGQYWGSFRGTDRGNNPLMSGNKAAYKFFYYGKECFKLQQVGVEDPLNCIKTDGMYQYILNFPLNNGDQQLWKFESVAEQTDLVQINWFPAQSTSIVTLPFDLTGDYALNNLNSYVETYAVNSVVKDENTGDGEPSYTLTLTAKDEFKAGEPFVLVTTAEPDENGQQPLAFLLPPAEPGAITDTSAVDCNGLVGTLEGMNISGQASLYFDDSELNVCSNSAVFVPGRSGYIDVARVQDLGGSIDKTISINGVINNIANVEISAGDNASVDVYTVDGVLLKRNVKAAEATQNLPKGIYIVGKKKVLVK